MADNENLNTDVVEPVEPVEVVHDLPIGRSLLGATLGASAAEQEPDEEYSTIPVAELVEVKLGRQGENNTQTVVIDCSAWLAKLPGCTFMIAATRPGEREIYLPEVSVSSGVVTWPIMEQDTACAGAGRAEVRAMLNGKIKKSALFRTRIEPALEPGGSPDAPTPPNWVKLIIGSVEEAQAAAEHAEELVDEATACAINAVRFDEGQDLTEAQKATGRGNIDAASVAALEAQATATAEALAGKVAVQQGSANAGKVLVVGADGNVGFGDAGIPSNVKAALLEIFRHTAYADSDGTIYYNALYTALNGSEPGPAPTTGRIYGFHINGSSASPSDAVTYLEDAVGMTPAMMNFSSGEFSYGSWENAFFMPRPCMLRYNGTVAYYLDPDDYTKKADGTASDVANDAFQGNAMMEWGRDGKRIWYKIVPDADNTSASVYIADYQADSDYHCYSFINSNGSVASHFYTPIYNGSIDGNGRLRSLSGKSSSALCVNKTVAEEVAAAEMNNTGTNKLWYTEVYSDVTLINLLLMLIGKSTDFRDVFGHGLNNQSSPIGTGTMNANGMFYGANNDNSGVKIFGMENWWGNLGRRYAGHMLVNYVHKYKMTYPYNTTGEGYESGATVIANSNMKYILEMAFDGNCAMPIQANPSENAVLWEDGYTTGGTSNPDKRYAVRGGSVNNAGFSSAYTMQMGNIADDARDMFSASLSCKPLS